MANSKEFFWVAIASDGTLWGGGRDNSGQLGQGVGNYVTGTIVQLLSGSGAENDWKQVAIGADTTVALKNDGTLWSCGTWTASGGSVYDFLQVGTDTDWAYIAAGGPHAFAIKANGELYGWGDYGISQLTLTDQYSSDQFSPVRIGTDSDWAAIWVDNAVWATKTTGELYGWGYNYGGVLATGGTSTQGQPVLILSGDQVAWVDINPRCAALVKKDGTLWAIGYNNENQFTSALPGQMLALTQIGTDSDWQAAVIGQNYFNVGWCLALKTDGTLWACGGNGTGSSGGYLAQGDLLSETDFVPVPGHSFGGVTSGFSHALAIDTAGGLWGWGNGGGAGDYLVFSADNPEDAGNYNGQAYVTPVQLGTATYSTLSGAAAIAYTEPLPIVPLIDMTEVRYQVILTGAPDGLSDVLLPCQSVSARLRSGSSSYLSVSLPATAAAEQAIIDRPSGEIVLQHLAGPPGSQVTRELARVTLETVRSDQGARSWSITLTGHKQTTNSNPQAVEVTGLTVVSSSAGTRRYRSAFYSPALRAGDTATFPGRGDDQFIIGLITLNIDARTTSIEITEAS